MNSSGFLNEFSGFTKVLNIKVRDKHDIRDRKDCEHKIG